MEQKTSVFRRLAGLVLLGMLALGFLAVCSLSTTPILRYDVGQDSAFFRLVGQGMRLGKLPYRDYFDMKGPYLFLLEYLGQLLHPGRLGAFLVQWVCLFVTLLFSHKLLQLSAPEEGLPLWAEGLLLLPGAVVLSWTMSGGNLTEELSLPFLMPCLYLAVKYLNRSRIPSPENQDHPIGWGFAYGVVFGIMALIRVTNAALLGAILLTVSCNLLVWRRFRNFFANAGMFLLGVAAGMLPGCLWALWRGILPEMLYQVFVFGFAYSGEVGLVQKLLALLREPALLVTGLLPVIALLVYRVKDWKSWLLAVSGYGTLLLAAGMGNGYAHYFVLAVPLCVYGGFLLAQQALRRSRRRSTDRAVCLVLASALTLGFLGAQWPRIAKQLPEFRYALYCARARWEDPEPAENVQAVLEEVPEDSRDRLYVYGLPSCSAWYVLAGLQPPMRYCDWQPHYIQLSPELGQAIEEYLSSGQALYVVTPAEGADPAAIQAVLDSHYTRQNTWQNYALWVWRAE